MTELNILNKQNISVNVTAYNVTEVVTGVCRFPFEVKQLRQSAKKGRAEFINIPISFDIETSSTILDDGEKFSYMYHWQMCVGGVVVFGRTWDEWITLLNHLHGLFELHTERRARIFVHNLPYEFTFFQTRLPIGDVFARTPHKPLKLSLIDGLDGFEFMCTYSISGMSLEMLSKTDPDITFTKSKDLNHEIQRTRETVLNHDEMCYCALDVIIVAQYVQALINREKQQNVGAIPMTKTGFVRRSARESFGKDKKYRDWVNKVRLNADAFIMYNRAFMGGDTHANAMHCGDIIDECYSCDLSSSYPYRIVAEDMPLSPPTMAKHPDIKLLKSLVQSGYLYIADLTISNVKIRSYSHFTYIPVHKCLSISGMSADNGRVVSANTIRACFTSLDWLTIFENYTFTIDNVNNILYHYTKGLLPESMRHFVIERYQKKTTLKGVVGREVEYALNKSDINSLYGMCVTRPLNDEITFNVSTGKWDEKRVNVSENNIDDLQSQLNDHYKSRSNFLPYQIGVWITAYARRDLAVARSKVATDSVYWDTDSLKYIGNHNAIFDELNRKRLTRLNEIGYTIDEHSPADINGQRHTIGVWEFEYDEKPYRFRTLGAKKYFVEINGEFSLTVSGLDKRKAIPYLLDTMSDPLASVNIGTVIPKGYSGRTSSEYVRETHTVIIDGVEHTEFSYMNINPATYEFGDTIDHQMYISLSKYRSENK